MEDDPNDLYDPDRWMALGRDLGHFRPGGPEAELFYAAHPELRDYVWRWWRVVSQVSYRASVIRDVDRLPRKTFAKCGRRSGGGKSFERCDVRTWTHCGPWVTPALVSVTPAKTAVTPSSGEVTESNKNAPTKRSRSRGSGEYESALFRSSAHLTKMNSAGSSRSGTGHEAVA